MDVLWCTRCITSANRSAQDNIFILLLSLSTGMESVTINSVNFDFSIFSYASPDKSPWVVTARTLTPSLNQQLW